MQNTLLYEWLIHFTSSTSFFVTIKQDLTPKTHKLILLVLLQYLDVQVHLHLGRVQNILSRYIVGLAYSCQCRKITWCWTREGPG